MRHRLDEMCGHSIMNRHILKISFAMLVVVLSACARAAIPLDTTYPVRKLELVGERAVGPAFWLDNHRLLFSKIIVDAKLGTPRELAVWDTLTGRIEPAPSGIPADINCYDPETGYLRYFANRKDYMGGLPGKLRPIPRPEETDIIDVACRPPLEGELPGDLRDKRSAMRLADCDSDGNRCTLVELHWKLSVKRLARDDGYLWPVEFSGQSNPIVGLYDIGGRKVADLPFSAIESRAIRYAPFKRAYFIQRQRLESLVLVDDPHIGWWMYPDGRVEKVMIPPRTRIAPEHAGSPNGTLYYPTARGMLFYYGARRHSGDNVYLAPDEQNLIRVADGAATGGFSVSPDGCKVAFPLSPKLGAMKSDLVIVDLCRAVSQ